MSHVHIVFVRDFLIVQKISILWHTVLVILDHIIEINHQVLHRLFVLYIENLKVDGPKVVNDIDNFFVQLKEFLVEKVAFIHLARDEVSAGGGLGSLFEQFGVGHFVAFRQNVEVREADLDHGGDAGQAGCNVLGWLGQIGGVGAVGGAKEEAILRNCLRQPLHHVEMRVQFNLPWTVKNNKGIFTKLVQLFNQPINILNEVLHAVHEPAIRPEVLQLLDIFKGDQVANVDVTLVLEYLGSRIQVANF